MVVVLLDAVPPLVEADDATCTHFFFHFLTGPVNTVAGPYRVDDRPSRAPTPSMVPFRLGLSMPTGATLRSGAFFKKIKIKINIRKKKKGGKYMFWFLSLKAFSLFFLSLSMDSCLIMPYGLASMLRRDTLWCRYRVSNVGANQGRSY